jgi:hypothetical protein
MQVIQLHQYIRMKGLRMENTSQLLLVKVKCVKYDTHFQIDNMCVLPVLNGHCCMKVDEEKQILRRRTSKRRL